MSTYHVELSGALNLVTQAKAIAGEEALGTRYIGSRLWVNAQNTLTNLAEFEELDEALDPEPGAPKLVKTLPDGITPEWAGPMIVQGSAVAQVFLVRAAATA